MTIDKDIAKLEPENVDLTVTGLGPWSYSKLKLGQKCGLSFYLKYVIKLKMPEVAPELVTRVGTAAHLVIENLIIGKSVQDSFVQAKKTTVEEKKALTEKEWAEYVETLEMNITKFRERLDAFERKHKVKRYVRELKAGLTRAYEPTGFFAKDVFWRGVIDMGIQLESKDLIVIDHKTGAPAAMGLRNFTPQLNSYKILFHNGVEDIQGAQAGIHFIRDGEIILDDYVDRVKIETSLRNTLEFYLQGVVDSFKEAGMFKKTKSSQCKYCDYAKDCKAGNLDEAELRSKKYFPIKSIT